MGGIDLDIGELPDVDGAGIGADDDPERLAKIVAHALARGSDRFKFLRKFSRHFEGADKRSGLLSDVAAVLIELARRNPEVFKSLGKQAWADFTSKQAARDAAKQAAKQAAPNGNGGMREHAPR